MGLASKLAGTVSTPQSLAPQSVAPQSVAPHGVALPAAPSPINNPPPSAPPMEGYKYRPMVEQCLRRCVQENMLSGFYPENVLQQVIDRVCTVDLNEVMRRYGYSSMELVVDLTQLALYDTIIFWDDSGSMMFDEHMRPTDEKVADLRAFVSRVAEIATLFDSDGISIMPFKGSPTHGVRSQDHAINTLSNAKFSGGTPIGSNIENKILVPYVIQAAQNGSLAKPLLVIVVFDGAPDVRSDVVDAITRVHNYMAATHYGPKAVAYSFLQVGRDPSATSYLKSLDNNSSVGHIIDCTSCYEIEEEECLRNNVTLTPSVYISKAVLGAIDRSYDDKD